MAFPGCGRAYCIDWPGSSPALRISSINRAYGPPTTLPWGIKIDAVNRIAPWNNINLYPVEITRFHPTFAYEMLWNLFAAQLLIVLSRLFEEKIRPAVVFYGWLLLSGAPPDHHRDLRPGPTQDPRTNLSFTSLVAVLMAVFGAVLLLDKLEVIRIPFRQKDRMHIPFPPQRQLVAKRTRCRKHNLVFNY